MAEYNYSKEDWQLIKSIVTELIDLPHNQILHRMQELCKNNEKIIDKVSELMRVHLDEFQNTITPTDQQTEIILNVNNINIGDVIGKYTIIDIIGSGGMGQVFLAQRNDEVLQKVAIKVLDHQITDENAEQRFDVERRILASLDHSNITRLIDAGKIENHTYYVMEYVVGDVVDVYCKKNNLTLNDRLNLFLDICESVSYAHNNLVVHRDLKPSNILVMESGKIKLLDFGIAKPLKILPGATDVHKTVVGNLALTPQYAAPEQVSGDEITVSCDVYVLGLLLYRLITDQHAFDFTEENWAEIVSAIKNKLPLVPSKWVRKNNHLLHASYKKIKGDLDDIVLHALNKEPNKRYLNVSDFSEDIKCFINNQPIKIKNNHRIYRMKKQMRRNWLLVSGLTLLFIVLSTALFFVSQERDRAIRSQQRAEFVSGAFVTAFNNADPTKTNGKSVSALDILDQTTKLIDNNQIEDVVLESQLILSIAEVYRNLGEDDKSRSLLNGIKMYYSLFDKQDKIKFHNELIRSTMGTIHVSVSLEQINEAIQELGSSVTLLYTKAYILRILSRYTEAEKVLTSYFKDLETNNELYVPSCSLLGYALLSSGQTNRAQITLNHCLTVLKNTPMSNNIWEESGIHFKLGRLYIRTEEYQKAIDSFNKTIDMRSQLINLTKAEIAEPHIFLSDALLLAGYHNQALLNAQKAYDLRKQHSKDIDIIADSYLTKPLFRIGNYHLANGDLKKAKEIYEDIIATRIEYQSGKSLNTAGHYLKLGQVYCQLDMMKQAIEVYDKAIAIFLLPKYDEQSYIAEAQYLKSQCYYDSGQIAQSRVFVKQHWQEFQRYYKPGSNLYNKAAQLIEQLSY